MGDGRRGSGGINFDIGDGMHRASLSSDAGVVRADVLLGNIMGNVNHDQPGAGYTEAAEGRFQAALKNGNRGSSTQTIMLLETAGASSAMTPSTRSGAAAVGSAVDPAASAPKTKLSAALNAEVTSAARRSVWRVAGEGAAAGTRHARLSGGTAEKESDWRLPLAAPAEQEGDSEGWQSGWRKGRRGRTSS
jgi:hypothetical protein